MRVFALSLIIFACIGAAQAAEGLSFDARIGESSRRNIEAYLSAQLHKNPADISIASADLNQDGLSEFILRDNSCATDCAFMVVAESKDSITLLGTIPGRSILLGNDSTQGVRSLLAFESGNNDYSPAVYRWEPASSRYMMVH